MLLLCNLLIYKVQVCYFIYNYPTECSRRKGNKERGNTPLDWKRTRGATRGRPTEVEDKQDKEEEEQSKVLEATARGITRWRACMVAMMVM